VREIELLPLQTSDFLSALSGECQQFNNSPIGSTVLSGAKDDLGELVVGQNSVSSNFLRTQWYAFRWGLIEDGPTHAPRKKVLTDFKALLAATGAPPV